MKIIEFMFLCWGWSSSAFAWEFQYFPPGTASPFCESLPIPPRTGTSFTFTYEATGQPAPPDDIRYSSPTEIYTPTSAWLSHLRLGADAWDGRGSDQRFDGIDFEVEISCCTTTADLNNGVSEIFWRPSSWFASQLPGQIPSKAASVYSGVLPNCQPTEIDIILNSSTLVATPTDRSPARTNFGSSAHIAENDANGKKNVTTEGMNLAHEIGHALGYGHVNNYLSVLNVTDNGNTGGRHRITEDDYVAYRYHYAASGDDPNLMVTKFELFALSNGDASNVENFGAGGGGIYCPGDPALNYSAYVMYQGPNPLLGVTYGWFWKTAGVGGCSTVGALAGFAGGINVTADSETPVSTTVFPPNAPGSYQLCIEVDYQNNISEVRENDNAVTFDNVINVYRTTDPECM